MKQKLQYRMDHKKKTLYQSHTRTMTWLQMPCIESKMKKKKQHREWNVCSIEHDLNLQPTKDPNIVLIALFRQYTIKFVLLLIWSIPMYTQTHTLSRKRDREKRLSKDFWNILWTHLNRESVYEFNLNMIREACVCVCPMTWNSCLRWNVFSSYSWSFFFSRRIFQIRYFHHDQSEMSCLNYIGFCTKPIV